MEQFFSYISTCIMQLACLFAMYIYGKKLTSNRYFFDVSGKGTWLGKLFFSILLACILLFPLLYKSLSDWMFSTTLTLFLIAMIELLSSTKKIDLFFLCMVLILFLGLILVPNHFFKKGLPAVFVVIYFAFLVDFLSNILGKALSKLPSDYQWLRWRYPSWISANKSFNAVILAIVIVVVSHGSYFDPYFIIYAGVGAFIGDVVFSIYKRKKLISDFLPTLGPIGGVLDRVDSWTYALIVSMVYFL